MRDSLHLDASRVAGICSMFATALRGPGSPLVPGSVEHRAFSYPDGSETFPACVQTFGAAWRCDHGGDSGVWYGELALKQSGRMSFDESFAPFAWGLRNLSR